MKFADERDAQKTRPRGDESPARTHIHLKRKRHSHPHTARDAGVGFACKLSCLSACVCVALPALDANSSTSKLSDPLSERDVRRRALRVSRRALRPRRRASVRAFGRRLARHFDLPFLATSFGDFWGARWNLVAGASLRDTVYAPITEGRFFRTRNLLPRLAFPIAGGGTGTGAAKKPRKKAAPKAKARTRADADADDVAPRRRRIRVLRGERSDARVRALGAGGSLVASRDVARDRVGVVRAFFAQAPLVSWRRRTRRDDARGARRRRKTREEKKNRRRSRLFFSSERRKTERFSPRSSRWPTRCSSRPSRATAWTRASWRTCAKRWGWGSFRRFYK